MPCSFPKSLCPNTNDPPTSPLPFRKVEILPYNSIYRPGTATAGTAGTARLPHNMSTVFSREDGGTMPVRMSNMFPNRPGTATARLPHNMSTAFSRDDGGSMPLKHRTVSNTAVNSRLLPKGPSRGRLATMMGESIEEIVDVKAKEVNKEEVKLKEEGKFKEEEIQEEEWAKIKDEEWAKVGDDEEEDEKEEEEEEESGTVVRRR
jgi:hypothetical protein